MGPSGRVRGSRVARAQGAEPNTVAASRYKERLADDLLAAQVAREYVEVTRAERSRGPIHSSGSYNGF
ncbi:hypothetical protein E2562_038506 [Oryza meyeriana var. granulata]|uniref:Uncharacterized protein n=1 Tax=Oryza meyeriana var. granulata TaxID=110450 RepID=A0A6G1CAK4_9ORYZ|nr:hypothetical protein E2562_038506 [Oryza meyeriana var. granulata]